MRATISFLHTASKTSSPYCRLRLVCQLHIRTMASQARVQQPPWQPPPNADGKSIHIYNSLTRSKTSFAPLDPQGRKVTWYVCGPTVYDDAHVGHARNYVSTDVIRRILRDYFQFDVKFVMNITDVDDKVRLTDVCTNIRGYLLMVPRRSSSGPDSIISSTS